jgi:hypothetical protein
LLGLIKLFYVRTLFLGNTNTTNKIENISDWVSFLAYPNLGFKGFVVVVGTSNKARLIPNSELKS